jgi:hypothetical protein
VGKWVVGANPVREPFDLSSQLSFSFFFSWPGKYNEGKKCINRPVTRTKIKISGNGVV